MTNERNEMETNAMPETYNANLLVTYKSINDGEVTYPTVKVNTLEYMLDQVKYTEKQLVKNADLINQITDVLRDLCEILGHEPKQTISITGTISFEVNYDIPLDELEDFDAHYFLQDNLTIDSYNGDLEIESWSIEDSDVNY